MKNRLIKICILIVLFSALTQLIFSKNINSVYWKYSDNKPLFSIAPGVFSGLDMNTTIYENYTGYSSEFTINQKILKFAFDIAVEFPIKSTFSIGLVYRTLENTIYGNDNYKYYIFGTYTSLLPFFTISVGKKIRFYSEFGINNKIGFNLVFQKKDIWTLDVVNSPGFHILLGMITNRKYNFMIGGFCDVYIDMNFFSFKNSVPILYVDTFPDVFYVDFFFGIMLKVKIVNIKNK